ncbi:MAG: hypothetical protein QY318_01120 [Candidatus Dojkabacteria bacterium]|nr:MAG: hypothetical protein QY318_01120 [Candidatus Dojkabacteria bacterium]
MGRLSLLEKNAFLSIYANRYGLHATFAYSHYEIDRSYTFNDFTVIDWENDPVGEYDFWLEYLQKLGDKFEWEFLENSFSKFSMGKVREFEDEGEGVSAIRFVFDGNLEERSKSINAIHGYFPEVIVEVLDNKKGRDLLSKLAIRLGYRDALLIDLNLHKFEIFRSKVNEKTRSANLADIHDKPWDSAHSKISWDSNRALIEKLKDARLKAFATVDPEGSVVYNQWANLVCDRYASTSNRNLLDILRSYATVQLLSMFNSAKLFDGMGQGQKPTLLIITGGIPSMLKSDQTYLAILDGLQLRGSFDVMFSSNYEVFTLADEFIEGVNAKYYIVTLGQITERMERLFAPDIPGRPEEKKTVFMANITTKGTGEKTVYALASSIANIDLPKEEYVIDGDFVKGAYIEGGSLLGMSGGEKKSSRKGEGFMWHSAKEKLQIDRIVVDARYKPVVYGPDYRVNKNKISSWIGE